MAIPFPNDPSKRPGAALFTSMQDYTNGLLSSIPGYPQQPPASGVQVPYANPDMPSLVQVPEPPRGILGRIGSALQNPRLSQQLLSMGTEMLANSGYQRMPVTTGVGVGRGLQAFSHAGQSYDQMIAQQAADQFNRKIQEAQLKRAEQDARPSYGKASGVGLNPDTGRYEVFQLADDGSRLFSGIEADPRVQVLDTGSGFVPFDLRSGSPVGVPPVQKTVSPDVQAREDQKIREEQRAPEVAAAVTTATETAKAGAAKQADIKEQVMSAQEALSELGRLEGALGKLPKTPIGMKAEEFTAKLTGGDPEVQAALGEVAQISGRMLKYVERLPGAATDKDRDTFMASAGVIQNPDAPVQQRLAAVRSAQESYRRLVNKYGNGQQGAPQGAQRVRKWNPATGKVE